MFQDHISIILTSTTLDFIFMDMVIVMEYIMRVEEWMRCSELAMEACESFKRVIVMRGKRN